MTAAWRAGASCDHGVSKVLGPGASEDCSVARYGSIWACRSPGCCSIHSRAARQAWKYSSSVDSAAALTDVVTPPGEIPEPSAADGWVSEPVEARDFHAGAEALRYASSHRLDHMELCFEFEEPRYNFALSLKPASDHDEVVRFFPEGNNFRY